jgi:replication initiation and membrane attachment protein DnaB
MAKKKRKRKQPLEVKEVIQFLTVLITFLTGIINLLIAYKLFTK